MSVISRCRFLHVRQPANEGTPKTFLGVLKTFRFSHQIKGNDEDDDSQPVSKMRSPHPLPSDTTHPGDSLGAHDGLPALQRGPIGPPDMQIHCQGGRPTRSDRELYRGMSAGLSGSTEISEYHGSEVCLLFQQIIVFIDAMRRYCLPHRATFDYTAKIGAFLPRRHAQWTSAY